MQNEKIYADYNASSPLHPQVIKYLKERIDLNLWANPNSAHKLGKMLMKGITNSRLICANILGVDLNNNFLIFNSGSSEGIATVFNAICLNKEINLSCLEKDTLLISSIEHPAVVESANYYKRFGYKILTWPVNSNGEIDLNFIKTNLQKIKNKIALTAIIFAHNESGVIQPIEEIAEFCQENKIPFLSDTTQLIAKENFNFDQLPIDFAVLSAHKFSGPIGIGALIIKSAFKNLIKENSLIHGGGQEQGLRSGTQNYIGIECMGVALSASFSDYTANKDIYKKYRTKFEDDLQQKFPKLVIFGKNALKRLPQTTLLSYPGIYGPLIQQDLEEQNIFVSTSSACSDHKENSKSSSSSSSPSLLKSSIKNVSGNISHAMGFSDDVARGMLRISLGGITSTKNTNETEKEIREMYQQIYFKLSRSIEKLSKIGGF